MEAAAAAAGPAARQAAAGAPAAPCGCARRRLAPLVPPLHPTHPLPTTQCAPHVPFHAPRPRSYIEACESGSIFEGLLEDNIGVYATTAATGRESSWGTYCPGM